MMEMAKTAVHFFIVGRVDKVLGKNIKNPIAGNRQILCLNDHCANQNASLPAMTFENFDLHEKRR